MITSNIEMYELLREHGKKAIEHGGPIRNTYELLRTLYVARYILWFVLCLLLMIGIAVRIEARISTPLSYSCALGSLMCVMLLATIKFIPLKEVTALQTIKEFLDIDDWEEVILWLNEKNALSNEVSMRLQQARELAKDPCENLTRHVNHAMSILLKHRTWAGTRVALRNEAL